VSAEPTAFLGLGIMGWPQAANLRAAGHELAVWSRDTAKARRFAEEHGATAAETPAEAAAQADVIITMLPDAPEVESVIDRAEAP
jgi:3-hydroxyisobutyrate dehydrogenase